jgi:cytokinesis protein
MKIPNVVTQIISSLNAPHLPTRRIILEVLLSVVYCSRDSLELVFHGLGALSQANGDTTGCYDYWFQSLESALQGRGKMGSLVGASDEYKRTGGDGGTLTDYAVSISPPALPSSLMPRSQAGQHRPHSPYHGRCGRP